jgi:hypothetical protein
MLVAALAALSGCAGTTVETVAIPELNAPGKLSEEQADGIRYYEAAPFLLVYTDGKGGLNSRLLFLPDLTRKKSIHPYAVLASNESTLTFTNGVLTQAKTVVDETIVPKSAVAALEKAATAALAGALNVTGVSPPSKLPPPHLYKVVIEKDSVRLVGGPGTDGSGNVRMIDVTISQPATPNIPSSAPPVGGFGPGTGNGRSGS